MPVVHFQNSTMNFSKLGLRPELVEAVEAKGYTTPSPIQARAIPAVLEGRDVLGGAQTGTGKTAAFSLPMLQLLAASEFKSQHKRPRALVLAPTRELAAQVHQSVVDYGDRMDLRSAVISHASASTAGGGRRRCSMRHPSLLLAE